ncbi:lysoplasmalogenase family protein [Marimonas sp. MJW-29]|uniref:Lysoplasmalogenase family protein n=1 Tax=Sulfitobacter sediminis TaxID=3234186 RepID=A0ABV3RKY5_9RHOB
MLWAASGVAALIYWGLSLREGHSWGRSAVKGLALLPLVALALGQDAPLVALALALCSLGDVTLSRPGQAAFLGGLVAFALGHLGWIAVFAFRLGLSTGDLATPVAALLLTGLALLIAAMSRLILPRAGALRLPVAVYTAVIAAMSVTAFATGEARVMAGAVLFAFSDALLGLQTFVLIAGTRPERLANALIWPLYWSAIALLTLGALAA